MTAGSIFNRRGSAMLLTVFIVALAAALVMGMLQLNTEQTLQLRNQVGLTRAVVIAESGLNDALAQLRGDLDWNEGFENKAFGDGRYTVSLGGMPPALTVTSVGRTRDNYTARVEAQITALNAAPPYRIVIEQLRINQ